MSTKATIISILSTVVPIGVALISLATSIISNKRSNKSLEEVEKIKVNSAKEIEKLKINSTKEIERLKIESSKDLELLKEKIRKQKKGHEIKQEKLNDQEEALANAIKYIQKLKDEITIIFTSTPEGTTVEESIQDLKISSKIIRNDYLESQNYLCEEGYKLYHKAKNISINVCNLITDCGNEKEYIFEISRECKRKLKQSRNELTDIQSVLRDNRIQLIKKQVIDLMGETEK